MDLIRRSDAKRSRGRARAALGALVAAVVVMAGATTAQALSWGPTRSGGQPVPGQTTYTTVEVPDAPTDGVRTFGVRW